MRAVIFCIFPHLFPFVKIFDFSQKQGFSRVNGIVLLLFNQRGNLILHFQAQRNNKGGKKTLAGNNISMCAMVELIRKLFFFFFFFFSFMKTHYRKKGQEQSVVFPPVAVSIHYPKRAVLSIYLFTQTGITIIIERLSQIEKDTSPEIREMV